MKVRALSPFAQIFEQLPHTLPIFPLPNALLIPGGRLPLNIFEHKYLNMIADAMSNDALVGMIQPKPEPATLRSADKPSLYEIGCAGRITDYSETDDGRLEIVLSGLCRFAVKEELSSVRGYRVIRPDWSAFRQDYERITEPSDLVINEFMHTLRAFLEGHNMPADWDVFEKLSTNSLISSLMNVLPIDTGDRQTLLEANSLERRILTFTAILNGTVSRSQTCH